MIDFVYLIFIAYIAYLFFDHLIIESKYKNDKNGIELAEELTQDSLYELLKSGFQYPNLRAVERGNSGKCIIYGKYGTYELGLIGNRLYVGRSSKPSFISTLFGSKTAYYLEGEIVKTYLTKFLNPSVQTDAYKKFDKFSKRIKMQKTLGISVILFIAFFIITIPSARRDFADASKQIAKEIDSSLSEQSEDIYIKQVKNSYFTQYNDKVTIGDAFKGFFGAPKWISIERNGNRYLEFTGQFILDDQEAEATIIFLIEGDLFSIDSLLIDGEPQDDLMIPQLMDAVYSSVNKQ